MWSTMLVQNMLQLCSGSSASTTDVLLARQTCCTYSVYIPRQYALCTICAFPDWLVHNVMLHVPCPWHQTNVNATSGCTR